MTADPFTPISEAPDGDRWDNLSGFWGSYQEPASHVARLVQSAAYRINSASLSVAYMRDWRDARRSRSTEKEER